jgi:hypothetical protein
MAIAPATAGPNVLFAQLAAPVRVNFTARAWLFPRSRCVCCCSTCVGRLAVSAC